MSAEGEIKTMQEKIQGKLKMLEFTAGDTAKVIETGDLKTIKRHGSALEHVRGGWQLPLILPLFGK